MGDVVVTCQSPHAATPLSSSMQTHSVIPVLSVRIGSASRGGIRPKATKEALSTPPWVTATIVCPRQVSAIRCRRAIASGSQSGKYSPPGT